MLHALQYLFRSGILPALRLAHFVAQFEFPEEHIAHLFRRSNRKGVARQLVDMLFDDYSLCAHLFAALRQCGSVELHTVALHSRQHGHERHLNLLEQFEGGVVAQLLFQQWHQAHCHIGILASVIYNVGRGEVGH